MPILGEWPEDPFNGKPMIYRMDLEKVYSVRPNLKDDGGDFTSDGTSAEDIGLPLKP